MNSEDKSSQRFDENGPLAQNIRRAVAAAGFSYDELAFELGVSRRTLWAWVNGRARPRERHLESLANQCGVSLDTLLEEATHPPPGSEGQPIQMLNARWNKKQKAWVVDLRIVLPRAVADDDSEA